MRMKCKNCEGTGIVGTLLNSVYTGRAEEPIYKEEECEFCDKGEIRE